MFVRPPADSKNVPLCWALFAQIIIRTYRAVPKLYFVAENEICNWFEMWKYRPFLKTHFFTRFTIGERLFEKLAYFPWVTIINMHRGKAKLLRCKSPIFMRSIFRRKSAGISQNVFQNWAKKWDDTFCCASPNYVPHMNAKLNHFPSAWKDKIYTAQ